MFGEAEIHNVCSNECSSYWIRNGESLQRLAFKIDAYLFHIVHKIRRLLLDAILEYFLRSVIRACVKSDVALSIL